MRKFDYLFLKESVPGKLVGPSNVITELNIKTKIKEEKYKDAFEALRKKAIIESVTGSNAIEGIVTTKEKIKDIVDGAKAISHNELEISGYKDALNLVHTQYNNLDLNKEFLLSLHKTLLNSTKPNEAGKFKTKNNLIIQFQDNGTQKVRFTPVSAKDTEIAIDQMLMAYYVARQDSDVPRLFLIPCVVLDFLCIHPFLDGNERISRLITVLLLYMEGYDIERYVSVEWQTNKYKNNYYDALEQSSVNWHENKNDYTPFVLFFLQILYRCYKELDDSFLETSYKKTKKSERIEFYISNTIVPFSKKDIQEKFPDINIKTIELTLSTLLKKGKIKKLGTYKDARYVVI